MQEAFAEEIFSTDTMFVLIDFISIPPRIKNMYNEIYVLLLFSFNK